MKLSIYIYRWDFPLSTTTIYGYFSIAGKPSISGDPAGCESVLSPGQFQKKKPFWMEQALP